MALPDIFKIVSLQEAFDAIDLDEDLAFDTETCGFYGKIRLAQFYQRGWEKALLVEWADPIQLFAFFTQKNPHIVGQYISYDITTIQRQIGGKFIPANFDDTFLLARLAFPQLESFSLDDLITYVADHDPYTRAEINKDAMHKANWDIPVLPFKMLYYAALDVYWLFSLYDLVSKQKDTLSYKVDMAALRAALDFQTNGLPVDEDRLLELYAKNQAIIQEYNLPINPNSYQQVREYLNSDKSDDLSMAIMALQGNEKAANVRTVKKAMKLNSFLNKFQTPDHRVYGVFAPSARSGRFTCSKQNLQQLPRASKGVFGVKPDSGRCLIYSDYSQLELRCIAIITGESKILGLYREGKDLHNYTAEMIFGSNWTKQHRQIAKTANFNLLYGGGAKMFQSILIKEAGLFLPLEECQRIAKRWKRLYPRIAAWQEKGIRDYHRGSLGRTPFGRRYKGNMMTDQLNIENQGFGADVAKLAMHYIHPKLKEMNVPLCNFIHDSFIAECDADPVVYEAAAKIIGDGMHEAWTEASKMVSIKDLPMPVKVDVGFNWGDIEEGDYFHRYHIAA